MWQFTVDPTASPHFYPPVAIDQSVTVDEDTTLPITLTAFDKDGPLARLEYIVTTLPQHGTLSGHGPT